MEKKFCAGCQQEKELECFHFNAAGWRERCTYCKECTKIKNRERYIKRVNNDYGIYIDVNGET